MRPIEISSGLNRSNVSVKRDFPDTFLWNPMNYKHCYNHFVLADSHRQLLSRHSEPIEGLNNPSKKEGVKEILVPWQMPRIYNKEGDYVEKEMVSSYTGGFAICCTAFLSKRRRKPRK